MSWQAFSFALTGAGAHARLSIAASLGPAGPAHTPFAGQAGGLGLGLGGVDLGHVADGGEDGDLDEGVHGGWVDCLAGWWCCSSDS